MNERTKEPNGDSSKDGLPGKPTNETEPACGPGCDCRSPSGGSRVKIAITLAVLLAMAGIITYKGLIGRQQDGSNPLTVSEEGFATARAARTAGPGKEPAPLNKVEPSKVVVPDKEGASIGKYLESMSELNKDALNQDAVFVFIPAKEDIAASKTTRTAILSAQKVLKARSINVGLYTLRTTSPDFPALSSQLQAPAILVARKGRGMEAVSGVVTETKLLQAFMSSSSAGGCCSSGSSSAACP